MRDSIVFYRSFYEALKDLPPEQFKESVKVIIEYGLNDKQKVLKRLYFCSQSHRLMPITSDIKMEPKEEGNLNHLNLTITKV